MKSIIFLVIPLFCSLSIQASFESEEINKSIYAPKLSKKRFYSVISLMKATYEPLAQQHGRKLEFLASYEENWAQAFSRRWETDQIIVFGGIAGIPGMTEDSLALILCHELGHLYGGVPYSDVYNQLAVEGQADYWATLFCFSEVVAKLPNRIPLSSSLSSCRNNIQCARTLDASLVMTAFFADNRSLPHPSLETPDISVVTEVLMTHPSPQCRLDTLWAGIQKNNRPQCWFPSM